MIRRIVLAIAVIAACYHLYVAGVAPFTALIQRPVHLALMASLGFLGLGVRGARGLYRKPGAVDDPGGGFPVRHVVSLLLLVGTVLSCAYLVSENEALVSRSANPTTLDLIAAGITLVAVLELARRATGWGIVAVAILSISYALAGPWLPGILAHRGYGPQRLLEQLYLSTEGIWGIPLGVSADFVYLFVFFGAVLDMAGGGALLIALADRVAGRTRGGPAKTAAVASAFMGSLSGSAVANVVTTGTFTIPLMRRAGFRPFFAGAIEAAASTGGQLMPPVMGAGAFILATWTNIPYRTVALAAAIPAILYYLALFAAIHFRAEQQGLDPVIDKDRPSVISKLHLLIPLLIIVTLLAQGRSPMRAAFWGVSTALLLSLAVPSTRMKRSNYLKATLAGASGAVQVAAACAAAGIVVGVASLTGIGLRMSEFIVVISQGQLFPALLLTAAGSIILGMGLPTTAAYVVLAALGAPALVELGVPLLAAHLFIFYFGCISNVTPPVSLAAYAAAGVASSPPMRTALTAMLLAMAGFLVPFLFVYAPPLLLEGSLFEILLTSGTGALGISAMAGAAIGYIRRPLAVWERAAVVVAGAALFGPSQMLDVLGAVLGIGLWLWLGRTAETSAPQGQS
ncbi:MAG: TRAP transporter fused permease subunit [Gammaproteobacteria bacterium]|nr:TRAP transporter fused permease subunit [Gammaproteobacteria bacterium]MYI21128.1 TRAP transporter fused permease subunit [Gammaproteobacteria bacterium]